LSRYRTFPREQIDLQQLADRGHDLTSLNCLPLVAPSQPYQSEPLAHIVAAMVAARRASRPVVLMIGGHPIKLGLSRFLIDLIERGWVTHLATNGAGIIHDFELAMVGGTSENVAKWIQQGQFGLWRETGRLNDAIGDAAAAGDGLGEGVGRYIVEHAFPYADLSLAAAGWRYGVPVTSHVTIGGDIIHSHANCNGAALGQASYTDFLIFAAAIEHLEGGVFLNIGSAVTGPEVYLKALSMARNVARQRGTQIRHFTSAVFDLVPLPENWRDGIPGKDQAGYYFRPWKTILIRTVADGGESFFVPADHRSSLPALWVALIEQPWQPQRAAKI
jgi:hypothetical protein